MNNILKLVDRLGFLSFFGSFSAWIAEKIMGINWNDTFILISSILGVVWLVMRIYDQFVKTRKYKKDNNIKTII